MLSAAMIDFCAPDGAPQQYRAIFVGLEIFTPLNFALKIGFACFCLPLSILPLLCASVEWRFFFFFFKCAVVFVVAQVFVANF